MPAAFLLVLIAAQGVDLEPASFEDVLEEYGALIAEGEAPLAGLYGMEDTTAAVLAGEFQPQGPVYVVLLASELSGLPGCVLYRDCEGAAHRIDFDATGPYGSWWFWELRGIHADDFDGDGSTDLMVVADYMTGMGPDGAIPFMVHSVLLRDSASGGYVFTEDLTH